VRAAVPPHPPSHKLRYALIGDGESPHLLKWAKALAPRVELWLASSRGVAPELAKVVASWRTLALNTQPAHGGDNIALVKRLPELARWLQQADADWINAHYLTSHGALAWVARRGWGLRAQLLGSAWGSDILVTPQRHAAYRWLTSRVLRACTLATSDSQHMAERMRALGAREVMVFAFGLDRLPPPPPPKQPWLFYANRGLEPIYRPQQVLAWFARVAAKHSEARLVVANDGSLRPALEDWVRSQGLGERIEFVGRLDAAAQARHYARAQWYLSLPESDSVAVSVLEAMAHGCIPVLSDLPANRELVDSGRNGLIVAGTPSTAGPSIPPGEKGSVIRQPFVLGDRRTISQPNPSIQTSSIH
jgi:L-malate glycosyltransferase